MRPKARHPFDFLWPRDRMSALLRLGVGVGLIGLVLWLSGGVGDILRVLHDVGWLAVAAISAIHVVPMTLCGVAWRVLLVDAPRGTSLWFVFARWIRDAVNQLAPFMPLGGEVISARLIAKHGLAGNLAAALTVADVTAEVMSQAAFSLIGLGLWMSRHSLDALPAWVVVGVILSIPTLGGLLLAQRLGLIRLLERLADKVMPEAWRATNQSQGIHDAIIAIYARRRRFFLATAIHLAAWLIATGEAWLALRLIGNPLELADVITMESVIFAVRNAAFLVPGGLGVQEGVYVLMGALFGVPPDAALALSLIKRGRELTMGLPGLLAWLVLGRAKRPRSAP